MDVSVTNQPGLKFSRSSNKHCQGVFAQIRIHKVLLVKLPDYRIHRAVVKAGSSLRVHVHGLALLRTLL